jgi:hypothetical protein
MDFKKLTHFKKMKNTIVALLIMTLGLVSCNQKSNEKAQETKTATEGTTQVYACPMHPEITGKKGDTCSKCGMELTESISETSKTVDAVPVSTTEVSDASQSIFSINGIVVNYLTLKNALTMDDSKGAAVAGKALYVTFNGLNSNSLDAKLKAAYLDIADDAKEHAEHIGENADKLEHQREHFVMLSKDINDLIKTFGTERKLYQDFCPMADDGKGAIWISETKKITNPYFGKEMPTCGSIKEEF